MLLPVYCKNKLNFVTYNVYRVINSAKAGAKPSCSHRTNQSNYMNYELTIVQKVSKIYTIHKSTYYVAAGFSYFLPKNLPLKFKQSFSL